MSSSNMLQTKIASTYIRRGANMKYTKHKNIFQLVKTTIYNLITLRIQALSHKNRVGCEPQDEMLHEN